MSVLREVVLRSPFHSVTCFDYWISGFLGILRAFLRILRFSSVFDLLVFWGLQGRLQPSPDLVPDRQSLVFFEIFEIFVISWLRLLILLLFTVIRQCDYQKHMVK